ncbi:hypothetical protein E0G79_22065 [Salmonella enterica]|nr:hypothetical protein [Salmonella enterica]
MNTEITLKGIPVLRSGYSGRGFTSAGIILATYHNSSNKTINVKYMGCHIGYISHIHYGDLPDGGVELRGDISFPISNLIAHREILNNKNVYPTCIIETASGANEARLSEVILFTEEEREFDGQEPLNLSELRELFEDNAEPDATTEPQGVRFHKKYDNANSGLIGFAECNTQKPQAVRLVSYFIPAINVYGKDEKSIDLIRRIISVVGASENCRQDEIEAAYKMGAEELIERLVRDWRAAFQPSSEKENKIHLNETDTLEAKDGYLVIKTNETTEAVKIEGIGIITSTKNKKGTNDICISTTSCGVEIRNSDIGTSGILKFIENYKMRAYAALKVNQSAS